MQLDKLTANGRIYPDNVGTRSALARFIQRVKDGKVYCEYGNPPRPEGMTDDEYKQRISTLDESRIAAHIQAVHVSDDGIVSATIKAVGPMGGLLSREGSPKIQFGLRGFAKPSRGNTVSLAEIVTYDVIDISPSE